MPLRAAVLAVACLFAVSTTVSSQSRVVDLLDRYAKHDFEAPVVLAGASAKDAEGIAEELEKGGDAWATAKGPRETQARRLVAATFALDVARVWSVNIARWRQSRRLLAWGCSELSRDSVPLEAERWWHLAAIGLFEGRTDAASLLGGNAPSPFGPAASQEGPGGHLLHALARFPNEPRFRLAEVVAREVSIPTLAWLSESEARPRSGALPPEITDDYVTGLTEAARPTKSPQRVNWGAANQIKLQLSQIKVIRTAHQMAGRLFGSDAIAGEAHLRYAYLSLLLGDRAGGVEHLMQAEALLTDPILLYAARVYGGSARERLNQPTEAMAAYRRALEVGPGARTAGLPLTSLLLRESRASEASAVAAQVLSNSKADPIVEYRRGDYRFVASYLEQLKRVLP